MSTAWELLNKKSAQELKDSVNEIFEKFNKPKLQTFDENPHPLTFLSYTDLVNSLTHEKKFPQALELFTKSLRFNRPQNLEVLPWNNSIFDQLEWEILFNSMATEPVFPRDLLPPSPQALEKLQIYLPKILTTLSDNSPTYWNFFPTVLNTIILAEPGPVSKSQGLSFGGATYFFFWGGTIINSKTLNSYQSFFEQLIHESCHMALFMLCSEHGLLCENPDTELYNSAFRSDSGRPMHGVIHAYFVAANLVECFSNMPGLSHIASKNARSVELLKREILSYARLTDFGKFIMERPQVKFVESSIELR